MVAATATPSTRPVPAGQRTTIRGDLRVADGARQLRGTPVASRFRGTRLAVAILGIALLAFTLVSTAVVIDGPVEPKWALTLFPAVALVYIACGMTAWLRRPANQFGAILAGGGLLWACANLANTDSAALIAVGQIVATVPLAVIVHLLMAFPSGRLRDHRSRLVTGAAYFVCIVLQVPLYAFASAPAPFHVLVIAPRPGLHDAGVWLQRGAGIAVMAATAVLLAARWHASPRHSRLLLGPLYGFGILVVLAVPMSFDVIRPAFDIDPLTIIAFEVAVTALVPIGFVACIVRGGFARTAEIEQLGAWLGADEPDRPALRAALAEALGDRSLELVFANDVAGGGFIDADGIPISLPLPGSGRTVADVELAGRSVGAMVYDRSAVDDHRLVRAAGRVVALAIDRERLTANLRASAQELRESRARIHAAADAERRRIACDLHDGLQAHLLLLGIEANRCGATGLQAGIDAALGELREFVHDIMPARLIEQGLFAAIEDLADRSPVPTVVELPDVPVPLPPSAESTAYFVVAEALSNALKHSGASEFRVRVGHTSGRMRIEVGDNGRGGAAVTAGRGLRGIADRVEAVGGRFWIDSRRRAGTLLVTELPCAF